MGLFERIVVAVDFSDFSQEALRIASGLAGTFGGSVTALYVCDTPKGVDPAVMVRSGRAIRSLLELQEETAKAAREKLADWVERFDWGKAKVQVEVEKGASHARILARSRELDADLIVLGIHGRSGFAQMFIGTTTERVVRKSTCPVLAVTFPGE